MKNRITLIVVLSFFFLLFSYGAEKKRMRFKQISLEQGLSNSTVISIAQDKNEMLWFATYDGLNRYDGYTFTTYRNERSKRNSLQSSVLRVLFLDSQGELWIGSKDGLSLYVFSKDNFENYTHLQRNGDLTQINAIAEFSSTHLLLGTEQGLLLFNKKTKQFENFQQISHLPINVQALSKHGNTIFIGTNNGLYLYDLSGKYINPANNELEDKIIQAILPQSDSRVWIGTEGSGLFLLNPLTGEIKNYKKDPNNPNSLASNYIRSLCIDSQHRLWVGTFHALSIMINGGNDFENYFHDSMDNTSISQNSIRSIYMDTQGGMWLGTYYGGLNYYHILKNQFGHIQNNPYTRSLNDKVTSCIVEDSDGRIWIGTNDKGVNVYNPSNGDFVYFNRENNKSLTSNNIKAFLLANDNRNIYVGTHGGGLLLMNKQNGACQKIPLPNENVYALSYDKDNNVWIGTLSGLFCYNERTKSVFKIAPLESKSTLSLKVDSKNRIWIGGEKELSLYSPANKTLQTFKSKEYNGETSNGAVNCIFEDSKKRVWLGTRGGLSLFGENKKFTSFTKENGLPNNVVYGILEDSFGRLWLSTNNGISCFTPDAHIFRNYSETDGLPFRQFNNYSYFQARSGLMYFGGINGVVTFYPETLIDNPYTSQPRISRVQVFNKDIYPLDKTGILKTNILNADKIRLKPGQSNFSLEFTAPNYLSNRHNTFAYKLEGLDKEWNTTSENRFVSYANLKHGKYVFKVKAANSDGKWNDKITELTIIILPHWWQTWWAYLLYLVLFGFALHAARRITVQRQLMRNQLSEERLEKEKMQEVNQMKTSFFINISHEFRTPLTLILSPIQEILERTTDKWERSQLSVIQKNANKMLRLVNQLMDYRRAELGVFELQAHYTRPQRNIYDIFLLFEKLAKQKNIDYVIEDNTNEKEFLIDVNYLDLILNNLLSNAFKFTPENGKITLRIEEDVNHLVLEVEDTGCGIPANKQTLIFDRFYQIENTGLGTGIGLSLVKRLVDLHHGRVTVQSEVAKGSKFSVFFPQNTDAYNVFEISVTPETEHIITAKNIDFLLEKNQSEKEITEEQEKQGTVLVVEDNADVLSYLSERLGKNYNVIESRNGVEALEKLKKTEIDLILTDVMMPEMDGIKLSKIVKQNIRTCHIPIIILSAKAQVEDELQGLKVGADDYVAKPFTYSILNVKIRNMLKARKRILEHYSTSLEVEPEKITFNQMDKELLTKAVNVVTKHLDDSAFSADIFCDEMAMSRSNLHLKLKAITGESTIDFIRKIRFNEACKLLMDGRYSIAEVSEMVGFNTPSYFATSFKKYFGYLPTEYVKNRRS